MKTISLKIDDLIFQETENILAKSKKPRNRYINEAIDYYNKYQKRLNLEKKLVNESSLVAEESKIILNEFESIAYNYETI
jgi:metal-responsive CopG/Arc/MetJ family transcriptional regulator